ncbi:helix-turn-helix domain-containing protein [Frondihabitans australicus]|nr:helix-turn-helix domain-containing protein [Frondihabitans australicus]
MATPARVGTRTVDDPLALRALAHPLRRSLYSLVAREGTLTSAEAAKSLDISHALASHHLRQLAKYGFVEPAEATDARARPWRVATTSFSVDSSDPDSRAPADYLERHAVEQAAADLAAWQERRAQEPRQALPGGVSESLLYLTPDELAEALAAWRAVVAPLAERRPIGHHDTRPADAVPVSFTLVAVPLEPTEHGG